MVVDWDRIDQIHAPPLPQPDWDAPVTTAGSLDRHEQVQRSLSDDLPAVCHRMKA